MLFINKEFPLIQIAWKMADRTWNLSQRVEKVSIDEHGNPWFINDGSKLRYINNGQPFSWDLLPTTYEERIFSEIIGTSEDQGPWILLGKRLLQWDKDRWESFDLPSDANIQSYSQKSVVVRNMVVWGIDSSTNGSRIIQIDLTQHPFQSREIFLPSELTSEQYKFDCIALANENALLAFISNDEKTVIYNFQDGSWRKITEHQKEKQSKVYWGNVVVDAQDQIWVVLESFWWPGNKVGKYNPQEDKWTWFTFEYPDIKGREFEYDELLVDKLGRVWISGFQYKPLTQPGSDDDKSDYTPEYSVVGVYEVRESILHEVRHYTPRNSSLDIGRVSRMLLGSDGKIWTGDKRLVWMDSNVSKLALPLPEWASIFTRYEIIIAIQVFGSFLIIIASFIRFRERKRMTENGPTSK
jgi:hypothetical protein